MAYSGTPYPTGHIVPGITHSPPYPVAEQPANPYAPPDIMPPPYATVIGHNSTNYPAAAGSFEPGNDEAGMASEFTTSRFSEKSVRHAFIRKVYLILSAQMLITVGFIALFVFSDTLKYWVQRNRWIFHVSYALFIVLYFTLVCCEGVRRRAPGNFITLFLFTVVFSFMAAIISSTYSTVSVLGALGITCAVCLAVTLFAVQTRIDFTKCTALLLVLSVVFIVTGLVCSIVYAVSGWNNTLHIIYGSIGALVFGLYLIYDTQMVLGGRRHEISPEEYIFAALQLYVDIVNLFLIILSLFGSRD